METVKNSDAKSAARAKDAADKAAALAALVKSANASRRDLDTADREEVRSFAKRAEYHAKVGARMIAADVSDRMYAIVAEHGSVEAFKATGAAQPTRLTVYRRARMIAAAIALSGADVSEAAAMFAAECQSRGVEPTGATFAEYCGRGFEFPAVTVAADDVESDDATTDHVKLTVRRAKSAATKIVEELGIGDDVASLERLIDQLAIIRLAAVKAAESTATATATAAESAAA